MRAMDVEHHGGAVVVRLYGDIDLANAREVRSGIDAAPGPDTAGMVVDLSETSYVDSTGISILVRVAREFAARRQQFVVVAPEGGAPRRVLDIVQMRRVAPVHDSLGDALGALDDPDAR